MYMLNGRSIQVGRNDGRSLGFYGTGKLGVLDVTSAPDPNGCYQSGYDAYGVSCLYLPIDAPSSSSAQTGGQPVPTVVQQQQQIAGQLGVSVSQLPGNILTGSSGMPLITSPSSGMSTYMILAVAVVGLLVVMKR